MKQLVFAFAALMVLCACQEKSRPTAAMVSDADSIYTDQYIKMHFVKEPERCLGLIDTAEMKGTMTVDSCSAATCTTRGCKTASRAGSI